MRRIRKLHLIGIGGSGMAGIAEVLLNLGYQVSGSDQHKSRMTERLVQLGATITYAHIAENVADCDAIIVSSAIDPYNIEVVIARKRRIPIVPRAEMLAELMRFQHGIAIAGTHGKTTTTSLVASLLAEGGEDPTFVIGGQLNSLGSNAKLGTSKYFVAEADESDASFLHLTPTMAVVTNIDADHMATYNHDFEKLKDTFVEFLHRLPFYGLAVLCIDNQAVQNIIPNITRPIITYGFSDTADVKITAWSQTGFQSKFKVNFPGDDEPLSIELNLPGKHNALNAVAAMIVAREAGVSVTNIQKACQQFHGVGRRFQQTGTITHASGEIMLLDDYGHHPAEVKAVIDAIRQGWPNNRLVMIYQPHRYSRTKELYEDFVSVLSEVDELLLLEVYSAGESPIPNIDSRSLCGSIRAHGNLEPHFVHDQKELIKVLKNIVQPNDIVVTQGAGSVGKIAVKLQQELTAALAEVNHLAMVE